MLNDWYVSCLAKNCEQILTKHQSYSKKTLAKPMSKKKLTLAMLGVPKEFRKYGYFEKILRELKKVNWCQNLSAAHLRNAN